MPHSAAVDLAVPVGRVEGTSVLPNSGSRRRAVVAANHDTCDLYVFGMDGIIRMFNPKAPGQLQCIQLLRPQLLEHDFLRSTPSFWQDSPDVQSRRVREAVGPGQSLDMPHEVVELRLNEASGLVALVGVHRVSVLVLPRSSSVSAVNDNTDELDKMLGQLGLSEYGAAFREQGYSNVHTMLRMSAAEREGMTSKVGMLPGHSLTMAMHLEGRLPALPAALPAGSAGDAPSLCWAVPIPLPTQDAATAQRQLWHSGSSAQAVQSSASAFLLPSAVLEQQDLPPTRSPSLSTSSTVVQVEWHPLGESHLGVLLSDGTFFLVDTTADVHAPELVLRLPLVDAGGCRDAPAGFCFGTSTQGGWSSLSTYFASASGAVHVACPVLPSGERARGHVLAISGSLEHSLADDSPSEAARAWLRQRAGDAPSMDWPDHESAYDSFTQLSIPQIQGPLRIQAATASSPTDATTDARSLTGIGGVIRICHVPLTGGLAAILLGRTDHSVAISLLADSLEPRFVDAAPHPPSPLVQSSPMATPSSVSSVAPAGSAKNALTNRAFRASCSSSFGSWEPVVRGRAPKAGRPKTTPSRSPGGISIAAGAAAAEESDACAAKSLDSDEVPRLHPLSVARLTLVDTKADQDVPSTQHAEPLRWMHMTLDLLTTDRLFVHTSAGSLHVVHFPWLHDWARFLLADPTVTAAVATPPAPPRHCAVRSLIAPAAGCYPPRRDVSPHLRDGEHVRSISLGRDVRSGSTAGVVGIVTVSDPRLGDVLFAVRNDGSCSRVQLELALTTNEAGEAAASAGGATVEAHYDAALRRLSHHRIDQLNQPAATHADDDVAWARTRAELEGSTTYESLAAFESMLAALAGPRSTLRRARLHMALHRARCRRTRAWQWP